MRAVLDHLLSDESLLFLFAEAEALHQRLEGAVVPAPRERDQALVALQPQERRAPGQSRQCRGLSESRGFHG